MTNFINNILPGNYWLTKSMEFVKVRSSGTLWYLKKWIVYYYYIFLKSELHNSDYSEIIRIFEAFINSLPSASQDNAKAFFYNINIKNEDSYVKLSSFINLSNQSFENQQEKDDFINKAKRYYFMYIMDSGGQAGWKKKIKEKITDGKDYPTVISEMRFEMTEAGLNEDTIRVQFNDYPASIRNERQIFFYYGLFHGRDLADLSGFYNLTNVGKTIINSNFHELIILWEHQKLLMVSQSPIADIQNISRMEGVDYGNFSILNHPYFELLHFIQNRGGIDMQEYQFIVSKYTNNNIINPSEVTNDLVSKGQERAQSFNRRAELESEDFLKEIKKFILGVCDLSYDNGGNYFSFLSWINNNRVDLVDGDKGSFILKTYSSIVTYLNEEKGYLYKNFSNELNRVYNAKIHSTDSESDEDIVYDWYKYIINFDKNIILHLLYTSICLQENMLSEKISEAIVGSYYSKFENLLKYLGIKKKQFIEFIQIIKSSSDVGSFYKLSDENANYSRIEADLREIVKDVDITKLKAESEGERLIGVITSAERKRNGTLIKTIRSFYEANFADTETRLIKCDCCGNTTFFTENGLAYIEFHHLIPFSTDYGPDHYLNLFGLCPNCHRKMHHLNKPEKPILYENLSINNNTLTPIIQRIELLFSLKLIEPIHLDFLKKEGIINKEEYENFINQSVTI